MRFFFVIVTVPAILFFANSDIVAIDSGDRFSPELIASLNQLSGLIYNDQFESAGAFIDSMETGGGPIIFCHLFRAVLYQSWMMAAESDFLEKEFFTVLDSLQNDAKSLLDSGSDSALAYYFIGHAHAFRSVYHGRSGSLWKALKDGLGARKAYSRGYKIDSTFHDIALGLGSYRYWKSVKTKAINWTPLFKNERQNGIDLLRLAVDSSRISSDAAAVALIWVYINEELLAEAIHLARIMHDKYPEGLTFLWAMGEAYYKLGDCPAAIEIYSTILSRLKQRSGNYYNIIETSYFLSECYRREMNRSPETAAKLEALREYIRNSPIPEKTEKRQRKKIKHILHKSN